MSVLKPEDERDELIGKKFKTITRITVGCSSGYFLTPMKKFIKIIRPKLRIVRFKGNLDSTSLYKISNNIEFIILAAAGLKKNKYL